MSEEDSSEKNITPLPGISYIEFTEEDLDAMDDPDGDLSPSELAEKYPLAAANKKRIAEEADALAATFDPPLSRAQALRMILERARARGGKIEVDKEKT